ncbi:Dpy-30 and NDK domain containing protein [Trichuris trichiura]|uniref:Dpy-30 and NDK domain containing protein n=1 Tax=Trichuris trichiura TaxID=36087 RepID=A0A077ZBY7_TRITR|nr:Dpy-30 and NDK domain containing protein [Trichuris trichiura]
MSKDGSIHDLEYSLLENTLAIVKPRVSSYVDRIEEEIRSQDIAITEKKYCHLTELQCSNFYIDLAGTSVFNRMVNMLSSSDSYVFILNGRNAITKWKNIIFNLDNHVIQNSASEETIITRDDLHGSEDYLKARREIKFFFPEARIAPWDKELEHYLGTEIMPILTKALIDLVKINPPEPLKWLASWLWRNDPDRGQSTLMDDYWEDVQSIEN